MTRRAVAHAQRARRLLSQEAMKRSHRRGELIRYISEEIATSVQSDPKAHAGDRQAVKPLV
ncbi:MAG: hypothetical protein P9E24_00090 [Candidatus Competibacter sp.]|nr:hypothetical protein [Candidatus Competibacter sp.]MDG4583656.1 hypothetical protein [Candidatus Competibacter sp.]